MSSYDAWKTRAPDVDGPEERSPEQQRADYEDEMQQSELDRPYRIYRHGFAGRNLYDTQRTKEGAEASMRTGQVEYPGQKFEIEVLDSRRPEDAV